jgi:hypothetical protein
LPKGSIAWSLLWLLFEVGQHVEVVYDLTGEKVSEVVTLQCVVLRSDGNIL